MRIKINVKFVRAFGIRFFETIIFNKGVLSVLISYRGYIYTIVI